MLFQRQAIPIAIGIAYFFTLSLPKCGQKKVREIPMFRKAKHPTPPKRLNYLQNIFLRLEHRRIKKVKRDFNE